ncbi:hypothetical protein AX15_002833 [Amanita polypyramis BW_CC]|nr:hypothetical protein AX15_002833 [Amanita polypyramis BW_CC]
MRNNNTPANLRTTRSILEQIGKNTDTLDASWEVIEEIHKDKGRVDTVALNVLVQASVELGDLQRAMGTYKSFKEYEAVPDVETFNTLLDGCVASKHRQLGDVLLDDMKAAKIKPDAGIFEKMIYLCLDQDSYEDAFFYLEEMKAAGLVPPVRIYVRIVKRCLSANDARYRLALEEMREVGYATPPSLSRAVKEYLRRTGKDEVDAEEKAEEKDKVGLDGAAQRFIETGGLVGS